MVSQEDNKILKQNECINLFFDVNDTVTKLYVYVLLLSNPLILFKSIDL